MDKASTSEFCRLCLKEDLSYFSIFEHRTIEMFLSLTSIQIHADDSAPKVLCLQCLADLKSAYTIQQRFVQTHKDWQAQTKASSAVCIKHEADEIKESDNLVKEQFDSEVKSELDVSEINLCETVGLDEPMFEAFRTENSCGLPAKSNGKYERAYQLYLQYCKEKEYCVIKESALVAYFSEKSTGRKASSLLAVFSMLKCTLKKYHGVDISKFSQLMAFLKFNSIGYKPKKSQFLTKSQIDSFLQHAPDNEYLMFKVALAIGVAGGCCCEELCQLLTDDLKDSGSTLTVTIRKTKTKNCRTFTVNVSQLKSPSFLDLYRKYASLRPPVTGHDRFFISYRESRCTMQPVGIHWFGKLPSKVAMFLKLPNPMDYTGHCYKRSIASFLRDTNCDNSFSNVFL